jgi:hypothetical protein
MFGLRRSNSATLSWKRLRFTASVSGGRPLMTSVTLALGSTVVPPLLSSEPHAAADSATPATSRAPTALRSLDLFMGTPFGGVSMRWV